MRQRPCRSRCGARPQRGQEFQEIRRQRRLPRAGVRHRSGSHEPRPACNACRANATGAFLPVAGSPTSGWPSEARCTRISMRAAGLEPAAQQRRDAEALDARRSACAPVGPWRPPPSWCGVSDDGRSARRRRPAAGDVAGGERQVCRAHGCAPAVGDEVGLRGEGLRDDDAARWCPCRGGGRCRRAARRPACGAWCRRRVQQRCRPSCRCRMHDETRPACRRRAARRPRRRSPAHRFRRVRPFARIGGPGATSTASPPRTLRVGSPRPPSTSRGRRRSRP